MNVTVYATRREVNEKLVGEANAFVGGVSDEDLPGTATGYLRAGDPDAKLMYAYKVSRRCGTDEANCLPLSAPCPRLTLDSSTLGMACHLSNVGASEGQPARRLRVTNAIRYKPRIESKAKA